MALKILVAIPAFNESPRLNQLLERFPEERNYDLCFIDDGSTDGTTELLRDFGKYYIRHETNLGVGASIRDAIALGRDNKYDAIVIMAANGKMRPDQIESLVAPLESNQTDYVQGSRNLPGGESPNLPTGRKIAIKALTSVASILLGYKATDVTCGFRAYRLSLFDDPEINLNQSWLDRYELEYYIHYKVIKLGYRVTEVPVAMDYPLEKQNYSKIKPFSGWWSILRPWVFLTLRIKR